MSGEGQALDCATSEAYASFDDWAYQWYQETGNVCERFGNLDVAGWLYCFAPTKDGAVFLGALRLEQWQAFVDMVGKWDEWGASEWKAMAPFMAKEPAIEVVGTGFCRNPEVYKRRTGGDVRGIRQKGPAGSYCTRSGADRNSYGYAQGCELER